MRKLKTKFGSISFNWRTSVLLAVAVCLLAGGSFAAIARADTLQDQINSLSDQNSQAQRSLNSLQSQASSYQDAISILQQQISSIQAAIAASQAQEAQLQQQIAADQAKIVLEKGQLSATIEAMYIDGQTTTIEQLATSKNLSDYVDKQEYRSVIQNKLDATIKEIAALQAEQQAQKLQVDQLLQTQKSQQDQLDATQTQENELLAYNEGQQAAYNQQIKSNDSQITKLKAQQAAINNLYATHVAINSSSTGGLCDKGYGNGSYPALWCNNRQDTIITLPGNSVGDNRECTSYAYWYFTSVEGKSLHVSGDAGQWWYTANRPVDQTPEVGAIGVEAEDAPPHYSPYGHVMIVQGLPGQNYPGYGVIPAGDVLVSSMNEDESGHFEYDLWPANTLYYIH